MQQCAVDVEGCAIEGIIGYLQYPVGSVQLNITVVQNGFRHVSVGGHDSLRLSGRTGRIDDIGRTVRAQFQTACRRRPGIVVSSRLQVAGQDGLPLEPGKTKRRQQEQVPRPAVVEDAGQPLLREIGIERNIGGPCFEDGKHAGDHIRRTARGQSDHIADRDASPLQAPCPLLGSLMKLRIGPLLAAEDDSGMIRMLQRLGDEQLHERPFPRIICGSLVERGYIPFFLRRKHLDIRQLPVRIGRYLQADMFQMAE